MTVYQQEGRPSIFACTVDGYCNIISYKENDQEGELFVESKADICLNSRIIRVFYRQQNYTVVGTEDGLVTVYEIQKCSFLSIGSVSLSGSVIDIVQSDCSDCLLHLLVSCEGSFCYEVEVSPVSHNEDSVTICKEIQRPTPCQSIDYGHIMWLYSNKCIHCSCEGIVKCCAVNWKQYYFLLLLKEDHSLYLHNDNEEYRIDVLDPILDFNVQLLIDNSSMPRIILICRDANFFTFYTDILQYYQCL